MNIQYGPIERWPGKLKTSRKLAPFKSSYTRTINLLERELRMVHADAIVIQLAIPANDWRLDGRPRADARSSHPGVIVSFMKTVATNTGQRRIPLSFPCDTFTTYESNLRAIALALEALRMVDRYGVTQNAEQYLGFKALPPPGPSHESIVSVEEAARFVASALGNDNGLSVSIVKDREVWQVAYRDAAKRFHPDAGGRAIDWELLQAAATYLNEHHHL